MKRSLPGVLLVLCALSACRDKPPGEMEPIPRPADYQEPPKAETARPVAAPPPVDPNKVVLRWKLAAGAPLALRLEGTPDATSSAPTPAPAKGKKGKGANPPSASEAAVKPLNIVYVLQRPESGDFLLRVAPEGAAPDQGTISERGFVLDGLDSITRTTATLMLELPRDPVGVGDKWSLGADLVDTGPLGPGFAEKKSDRRNAVRLTALTPEGDDQVATLEYDLHESSSGLLSPPRPAASGHSHSHGKSPLAKKEDDHDHDHEEEQAAARAPREVTTTVTVTGRGEFLVKAGRWRSWQGTLTSKTEGYTAKTPDKAAAQVPNGTFKLQLTPLDAVPPELQPEARK